MKNHASRYDSRFMELANKGARYCSGMQMKLLALLLVLPSLMAVKAASINTHYIVAFDQSVGNYRADYLSPRTLSRLSSVLKSAGFDPENDYLSMVAYTLEAGKPSMERFVRPYVASSGDTVKWLRLPDTNLSALFKNWPQGQPLLSPEGTPYGSMQSLAKPYIVMETLTDADPDTYVGRTIMLMVTDGKVNGTDDNYSQEWNRISTLPGADFNKFNNMRKWVFSTLQNFNEEFKFVEVPLGKTGKTSFPVSSDGNYKVIPYEVVAADKPSIHSVTDFPSSLPLQRVRGGYKLAVEAKATDPKYEIDQIGLYKDDGSRLGLVSDGNFVLIIPSDEIRPGDTLTVSMALRMNDGFYNGTLMSSDNPRYKDGMLSKQVVKIPDEAKVLGIVPLADAFWWWFPNDVFTAVMVWDLIILLVVIVTVGYILYRCFVKINAYRPSNDNLKITKV